MSFGLSRLLQVVGRAFRWMILVVETYFVCDTIVTLLLVPNLLGLGVGLLLALSHVKQLV